MSECWATQSIHCRHPNTLPGDRAWSPPSGITPQPPKRSASYSTLRKRHGSRGRAPRQPNWRPGWNQFLGMRNQPPPGSNTSRPSPGPTACSGPLAPIACGRPPASLRPCPRCLNGQFGNPGSTGSTRPNRCSAASPGSIRKCCAGSSATWIATSRLLPATASARWRSPFIPVPEAPPWARARSAS